MSAQPERVMPLRDRNLRYALLKAVADWINDQLEDEKALHRADLVARYAEEGTKSFDVRLPNGPKVATISLTVPKPTTVVVDEDALMEWAHKYASWLLDTEVHPPVPEQVIPAQPGWVDYRLNPKRVTELLDQVIPVNPAAPGPVADSNGLIVDGVEHKPAAEPRSFSTRYTDDGRAAIAEAYHAGQLSHLVAGTVLPAIEAGPGQ